MKKYNIILTGSSGLIGEGLKKRLNNENYNIKYSIDSRSGFNILDMKALRLNQKTENISLLIHLASYCKIAECINEPELPFENNVKGMFEVMEFCRKNKIPKVVFASSSRVLSKEKNIYTASKLWGEELCKAYHECYGIEYLIIRPSTVYGEGHDITSRLITEWTVKSLKGEELPIYGDKNKTLTFTYISDFVDAFKLALDDFISGKEKNKEYNISGNEEIKLIDLASMIINRTGKGKVKFYSKEIAQPQQVYCMTSKELIKKGYSPKIKLKEGLEKVITWYESNPEVLK